MLKNYFKIAIRNLAKNKTFSSINILGMTIGIASFMLISVYVWDELQYDRYYKDKDRTYRIYNITTSDNGQESYVASIPPTYGPKLVSDYPEVESTLRIMDLKQDVLITIDGESTYIEGAVYAEPTIFDMLDVQLISGNPQTALANPNHVIISESLAYKLFGEKSALDETIELSQQAQTISGVYKDFPSHSHLSPPIILPFASFRQYVSTERMNSWIWHQFFTYVKFKIPINENDFEGKLAKMVAENAPPMEEFGLTYESHLQKITDIYLHSSTFGNDFVKRGNANTLYALIGSALFILVIVCLNFVNLSTTQSMSRMKEVGVRKIVGARGMHVVFQFIGESIILAIISTILAGFIVELSVTILNGFLEKQLSFDAFLSPMAILMALVFAVLLGTIAGLYPAIYASRFRSVSVLGVKGGVSKGSSSFRNAMVVVQFALSTSLIIVSVIVYQQVQFLRESDLGFNKEHIITIPLKPGLRKNLETTKDLFLANPNITSATYSFGLPGDIVSGDNIIQPVGDKTLSANLFMIDHDYISTMGLRVIAGRDFNIDITTDASEAFVINETAVDALGFTSPEEAIGKPLHWAMWHYDSIKRGKIIGVVRDFHFQSMHDEISTSVLQIYPRSFYTMAMRLSGDNINETIQFIEDTWAVLEPTWPITYSFIDQNFDKMYKNEKRLGTLITIFTCVGIFIACLGLFGLVNFSTRMRIKEIGVRKVMGASVWQVVALLTRSYILLLLISFVVAIPLSAITMNNWLSGFAYRISVGGTPYFLAAGLILLIALLTTSVQSVRAALINPVDTLKEE